MAIFDIIGFGLSSLALMILAKTRLVMTSDCCSMSYNDHNIDVHKLHRNDDEKEVDEDEKYDDLPEDSFKTLPPPLAPKYKEPINCRYDLRTLNKLN